MTVNKPTPRNLDPKFRDVEAPDDALLAGDDTTPAPAVNDDEPMIVHRVPVVDENGVQRTKEFGPMPVKDYAAWQARYERGEVTE